MVAPLWADVSWHLPLGVFVIFLAIVAIVRQFDVRLVLISAAAVLGTLAGQLDVVVRKFLSTLSDERFVIPICTALGFSYVLRQTGCDQHLVRLLVRPLVRVRFLLVPGTVLIGYLVNMPIVSQTSTALAIGTVVIPILRAAHIPAAIIGAALLLGSSIGGELFNPGAPELRTVVVESNKAAVERGDAATYDTVRCIQRLRPLNFLALTVALPLFCGWHALRNSEGRDSLATDSRPSESLRACHPADEATVDLRVSYLKAAVPLVPIVLLAIFAPGVGFTELPLGWLEDRDGQFETRLIGAAMLVGVAAAVLTTPREFPKSAESFFQGAGFAFANIVSIIVAANCFGAGLEVIGVARVLTDHLAVDPRVLIVTAGVAAFGFAVLCGSGMATTQSLFPFFAASALELGVDPMHVGAVVSLAAAAGRTMSPAAAVNQMCARLTDTTAIELSRRVALPCMLAAAAVIVAAMVWIP